MQIFEHMTVLGYPGNDYFKRFNLPTKLVDNFKKIKPKKIDISLLLNKNHFYENKHIQEASKLIMDMVQFEPEKR